jgi:hypothetical protein
MTRRNVRYPPGVARASGAGGRRPGTTAVAAINAVAQWLGVGTEPCHRSTDGSGRGRPYRTSRGQFPQSGSPMLSIRVGPLLVSRVGGRGVGLRLGLGDSNDEAKGFGDLQG